MTQPDASRNSSASAGVLPIPQIHQRPRYRPAQLTKTPHAVLSAQPMASLFEQTMALVSDALVLELMDRMGQSTDTMFARHANLE
eukprot:COSAG01_NODE_34292_length_550_cov_0.798226_1_plen_85_part_00